MPQLDALRFVAVLAVMVIHNWHPKRLPWLLGDLDYGGLAVRLFFVLSGFLITGILLSCRDTAERTGESPTFFIRQFYIRRCLRIFPVYYLVVFIALAVNLAPTREIWAWLMTFTANIYITLTNQWIGRIGHFWSLAVGVQFYLIWPWLILFVPRKRLIPILLFFILLAPAYRLYAYVKLPFDIGAMDFKAATFPLGNIDSLSIGALLALAWNSRIQKQIVRKYLVSAVLPAGLALYASTLVLYHYRIKPSVFFAIGDLSAGMIFAWLIGFAALGFKGVPGKILEYRPLAYLGKISYGIYAYHNVAPLIVVPILGWFGYELKVPGLMTFLLSSVLTIAIALASWHLLELPINNLKSRFPYAPSTPVAAQASGLLGDGE